MMARGWPAWSAILQYVIFWATVATTYIMSVKRGDQTWWLPTISNTGDERPQSGIFSIGMVLSTILLLFNIYEHVNAQLDKRDPENQSLAMYPNGSELPGVNRVAVDRRWNLASLIFGVITVLGMLVVACIQDNLCNAVHNTAAIVIFIATSVYLGCLHRFTWLSPRPVYLTALRISLWLLGLATFFGMISIIIILHEPHHSNVFPIGALFEWLFAFFSQTNMLAWFFMDFVSVKVKLTVDEK